MIALEKQLAFVDAELAKMPENQEKIMRLRYVEGLSWSNVGKLSGYSISHCRNINVHYSKKHCHGDNSAPNVEH